MADVGSMAGAGFQAGSSLASGIMGLIAQGDQGRLSTEQMAQLQDALARIRAIKQPDLAVNLPAPKDYDFQQYASPELAQYQTVNIDPADRQAQLSALAKLQGFATGAADSELNAANYNAINQGQMQRQAADKAALANLASRGTAGSGLELAARLQGSQNAANTSTQAMMEAARNNALAKLQGNNAYLQGMGNLRNQDTAQAEANANIINQFNMANTNARNAINAKNTALKNQQTAMNTGQGNQYQQYIDQEKRRMAQQGYVNQLGQAQAAAGQGNNVAQFGYNAGTQNIGLGLNAGAQFGNIAGDIGQGLASKYSNVGGNGGSNVSISPANLADQGYKVSGVDWGSDVSGKRSVDDEDSYG